jgi:hypothetical protein
MVRQGSRRTGLIGVVVGLIWVVLTVANLSPAEARMRGSHGGFRGGFGQTLHGGFRHGFHQHPFQRNVFFINAGVGGFFPLYPAAYPYPAYYPNYYPYYSPCGYYDSYGAWVNAACPPYAPPVSVPY